MTAAGNRLRRDAIVNVRDTGRRRAENVLFDQRVFVLDEGSYGKFLNLLSARPKSFSELKRLLTTKAPWER